VDNLKRLYLYDNSLIIVVADHGHGISTTTDFVRETEGTEDFNVSIRGPYDRAIGFYNPAILIKPPHQSDMLKVSRNSASNLGIRSLVQKYVNEKDHQLGNILTSFENPEK